jgi:hypothetical protein
MRCNVRTRLVLDEPFKGSKVFYVLDSGLALHEAVEIAFALAEDPRRDTPVIISRSSADKVAMGLF